MMSAIYHPTDFSILVRKNLETVSDWVKANPGKSIEECATALSVPYEVVFVVSKESELVVVPSTSGEIHWHAQKP